MKIILNRKQDIAKIIYQAFQPFCQQIAMASQNHFATIPERIEVCMHMVSNSNRVTLSCAQSFTEHQTPQKLLGHYTKLIVHVILVLQKDSQLSQHVID